MNEQTPILVTGGHRSGTTWVGRMLAADRHCAYVSEPLNVLHRRGIFSAAVKHWYTYIDAHNEHEYLSSFRELLDYRYHYINELVTLRSPRDVLRMLRDSSAFFAARIRRARALIKDPFAVFSTPWFARGLNCRVVITVRHPAAFANSLKRLNWPFDFRDLLDQTELMRAHLESDRAAMEFTKADDVIAQAALLWRIIYQFVHRTRDQFPNFSIVRHEDLSNDPLAGFEQLYGALHLTFDDRVRHVILNSSNSDNPSELSKNKTHSVKLDSRASMRAWKTRLDPAEIKRIREITEPVCRYFYSEDEW